MKIELTDEEAVVLQNLLNVACQARGLEAAGACLAFANRIAEASKAQNGTAKPVVGE